MKQEFEQLMAKLATERDEVNLKLHLASMEAQEEFADAEKIWEQVKQKASDIGDDSVETQRLSELPPLSINPLTFNAISNTLVGLCQLFTYNFRRANKLIRGLYRVVTDITRFLFYLLPDLFRFVKKILAFLAET
jgi:hypothetical protein